MYLKESNDLIPTVIHEQILLNSSKFYISPFSS